MATITTNTTLDAAARTAGETFTIQNGAVFTIDTHTRFHANAPASATGSLGAFTMTNATGGECFIDGTKVRMVAYSGGSGNVPAYNTSITQGGVSGLLLGVISALNAAPTAVGAAMPATGYIMFKTVTNGPFVAGALTGIGATVVGSQRPGFLEIVMDDAAGFTIGRAQVFKTRGQWFQPFDTSGNLITTSGTRGQQIQFPNFGGANFFIPWVEIETSAGSGQYEIWPAALAGTGSPWATANMGTDARAKMVQCLGGGIIRIGSDGTNNIGDLPPAGCNIRIPNILLKSAATASRASDSVPNATLATRPDFSTTLAGQIDIEFATGHWYLNLSQPYAVRLVNFGTFDQLVVGECATPVIMEKVANGNYSHGDTNALILTSNFAGFTGTDCKFGRSGTIGTSDFGANVSLCNNMTWTRCHFANRTLRTNGGGLPAYFSLCNGVTFNDCVLVGNGMQCITSINVTINNMQYADAFAGTSSATNTSSGILIFTNYCSNVVVNGFSWYTSVANVHHDVCIVLLNSALNVKVRNIGTRVAPLTGGSSNAILHCVKDDGNCDNVKVQRCYMSNIATGLVLNNNSTKNVLVENCAGDYADADAQAGLNVIIRSLACASWLTLSASIYGSIWRHIFTSATAGRLGLVFNEPTEEYAAFVTTNFTTSATGTSGFNSNGGLALINNGDSCIFEFPYTILGIESFQNTAPVITTATNMVIEYQINTGSGYGGTWKTFNAANLSAETVNATSGFKFKIRARATATNAANILTIVYALTNSNAAAQDVLYPLDVNTLTLTGLQPGSDVVIYEAGTTTVLASVDANAGSTYAYTYSGADTIDIGVFLAGYIPLYIRNLAITITDSSLPIAQVIDRAYLT
jgi:hypothetical protein